MDKTNSGTKNYLKCILSIISFLILFTLFQCSAIHAETTLKQDDKMQYCIETADDFIEFISNKTYQNASAILKNDITVSNMPELNASVLFKGVFDGSGKTIHFVETNYKKDESLFPWRLDGGTIKNVKINVQAKLQASIVGNNVNILIRSINDNSALQGISVIGDVTCVFDKFDFNLGEDLKVSTCDTFMGDSKVNDCEFSLNYILGSESDSNLVNDIVNNCLFIELYQIGGSTSQKINLNNCFSKAHLDQSFIDLYNAIKDKKLDEFLRSGLYVQFLSGSKSHFSNYYYDKEKSPCIEAINNYAKNWLQTRTEKPSDYDSAGKTTDEMKQQQTYAGFDFNRKWSISSDKNDGYPYYDPKTETITLEVQAETEPKVWHTDIARDFNRFKDASKNYHFPYRMELINGKATKIYDDGDNNVVTVTGAKFTNLTAKQQELVEKYGITAVLPSGDPAIDVKSAIINTDFLGERPLTVEWNNEPVLQFADGKEAEAENDGYDFQIKVVNGTGQVVDNNEKGASSDPANWESYYQKAKKATNIIMKYCEDKDAFGPKDDPSYQNTDIWAIFTAARCNYVPYGDSTYFDRWFVNTKEYLQTLKDQGTDVAQWRTTELSKLILAIESIGYDPRDISSVDLLSAVGERKSTDLTYTTVYAINAIKAGGYTADTFTDEELDQWAHETAAALLDTANSSLVTLEGNALINADNTMGWQPLIFWYNKPGFEDVNEAVDAAEERLPAVAQRATGSFCTTGFETGCASYGNNAWNDAQAMLFAGTFGINVLDPESGYTKNGNNILDAFFDLVDVDGVLDGSIHGFTNYDVPQIARGLDAFIRQYEKTSSFWEFTDVTVPTKSVNDMILALNDDSTKEQIKAARDAYNALDEAHKAIFNKDTLRKLLAAETGSGNSIEKAMAAIDAIPAADQLTLDDKAAVEKARTLYDSLNDEEKSVVTNYSKLTEAEAKIRELEKQQEQKDKDQKAAEKVISDIDALPSSSELTLDPYVLQLLDRVQAEYDALTDAQKALVTNYTTLQNLRNLVPDLKAAAAVADKIKAIGKVTSDNYLEKQAFVVEARTAYDALTAEQKNHVTNYADLETAELFISRQSTDEKVTYVITFIDELNITTSSTGTLSDGPLKLTEKNDNVPTENIWNGWKDYVVDARALYNTLDDQQKVQVTNVDALEKAEGYIYQLKSSTLKAMLEALPDAETVQGYEEPQPTAAPEETVPAEEQTAQTQNAVSGFSDGSEDVFSAEIEEQSAETVEIPQTEATADELETEFSTEEEIQPSDDTSKRELTEAELNQIAETRNAYDKLTETEEQNFRSENAALVENMEKLFAMALTYEKGQNAYQQCFAEEAAQLYASVKDQPADRTSYAHIKAFLNRYAKNYQGQETAMAGLSVTVGDQQTTFAEVITALTAQADKAGKDISDAQQADEWISNLPTAVTRENVANVEAELSALQKLIDNMSAEGKSYMWNTKQLELIKTIVADYHIELAGKQDAFKADMPADLKTKAINYKTVQISWSSVDNADGYMVYRKTAGSDWKRIASQVTDISYKDQKAVTGTTYYYTVKAYSYAWGKMTVSSYDNAGIKAKAKLGKVKISGVNSENYKTIRVTWNKVSGANGYKIYRSTSKNGKYTAIGSTSKNKSVTFFDKKAVTGKTYYYKVRAYRNVNGKKVYGSYSEILKAKAILSTPSLSVGSTAKTAVLEWNKIKGADGYKIYASSSKNGKYTRIKTTKGTGMTESGLTTGKNRYYKVRAYKKVNNKTVYGSFSKVKKVTVK